jgi:glycosyltransferase involved in cell wall biosynthesis
MTNIVVLTRNRFTLMKQTIESLLVSDKRHAHTGLMSGYTLLVVDDGSDDPQCQKYLRTLPRPHCAVLWQPASDHYVGELKSAGVFASEKLFGRGDWLCICDNDLWFAAGWLERMTEMAEASEQHGFRLWGGQNHPYHPRWDVADLAIGMKECETLAGTHFFMRWATWDAFGPLQSAGPGPCMHEDVLFGERLRKNGGRIGVPVEPCVLDCGLASSAFGSFSGTVSKMAGVVYE